MQANYIAKTLNQPSSGTTQRRKDNAQFGKLGTLLAGILVCGVMAIAASAQTAKTLATFNGANGFLPVGPLVQGSDGNFYGETYAGGAHNGGSIFKITPTGVRTTVYSFCPVPNCADGLGPWGGLLLGNNGDFYGTTFLGGNGNGTLFKITAEGSLTTLHLFNGNAGSGPSGRLIQAKDGSLYGTTTTGGAFKAGTVYQISASGADFRVIYSFCSQASGGLCADGVHPGGGVIQGTDGNLYGMTSMGGNYNFNGTFPSCPGGCGTIFRLTPQGALTTLHAFCAQATCPDGANQDPLSTLLQNGFLLQASNGNFYGMTSFMGTPALGSLIPGGTIFVMTPAGELTTLHTFCSTSTPLSPFADGEFSGSSLIYASGPGLIEASDGNLYGTSLTGGANNEGVIFQMTLSGTLAVKHSFCNGINCPDGASPQALVQGTDGKLYGVLTFGGIINAACGGTGCGTVFSFDPWGKPLAETLPEFGEIGSQADIRDTDPTETAAGGLIASAADPSVASVSVQAPTPKVKTLVNFNVTNGESPVAPVIQGTDGNFYGTTYGIPGGYTTNLGQNGNVFKVSPAGTETVLYTFCRTSLCPDGAQPAGPVVEGKDGNFYGLTQLWRLRKQNELPRCRERHLWYGFQGHPYRQAHDDPSLLRASWMS